MHNRQEQVFRCKHLILSLRKRNQSDIRALELYSQPIFKQALEELNAGDKNENN